MDAVIEEEKASKKAVIRSIHMPRPGKGREVFAVVFNPSIGHITSIRRTERGFPPWVRELQKSSFTIIDRHAGQGRAQRPLQVEGGPGRDGEAVVGEEGPGPKRGEAEMRMDKYLVSKGKRKGSDDEGDAVSSSTSSPHAKKRAGADDQDDSVVIQNEWRSVDRPLSRSV
ncbi:hypothetical protein CAPTEDRAFT_207344 [Capitella teleta]|uniref:Uncharacterized protein n=1 Tax=Capitella teleta TaxID=283909 RepID=R7TW70_CAPTE|nr:hypothetical protein CAPTEDRAFT_207344 [Capitella teleta]|eukprot:ELT97807.1 hypothetical protein CAPTEDRAFT_207344 [Capitella teleta]